VPAIKQEFSMSEEKMVWDGVEVKMTTGPNGEVTGIELPSHLRPDIAMGEDWYEDMMLDICARLTDLLENRGQSIQLTDDDIDDMAWKVHSEACWLDRSESESSGPKGGRRRDTGAEIAARSALDIAEDFDLPGRGVWEESVSGDLLNLIETIAREYKGRLKPVSFKRRYRLQQGKRWEITPLSNTNA